MTNAIRLCCTYILSKNVPMNTNRTVSGLFVILTNDTAGILWKMLEKVAETDFSGFLAAAKKQAASLTGEAVCFCVFRGHSLVSVRRTGRGLRAKMTKRALCARFAVSGGGKKKFLASYLTAFLAPFIRKLTSEPMAM